MATNFMGKIGLFTFIRRSRIPKQQCRWARWQRQWSVTSGENLVNFGPDYESRWSTPFPRSALELVYPIRLLSGATTRHCGD